MLWYNAEKEERYKWIQSSGTMIKQEMLMKQNQNIIMFKEK
jgi:hypothetical protein